MKLILGIVLFVIFFILSLFHFYWAFGGKWGIDKVLPLKPSSGQASIDPGLIVTLIVALGLLGFGVFYLLTGLDGSLPDWMTILCWGVPSIFLLRAVGDFRYVGFFKKITGTVFSKMDTRLFSPLCLLIATMGFLLQLLG